MMVTGDFLAMSSSTDNVHPSQKPSTWHIRNLTLAGIAMGAADQIFCIGCLVTGKYALHLGAHALQTVAVVTLVASGQAVLYVSRERRHLWSSWPSRWLVASSLADLGIIGVLAGNGLLMAKLSLLVIAGLLLAAVLFAVVLDAVKSAMFRRFTVA